MRLPLHPLLLLSTFLPQTHSTPSPAPAPSILLVPAAFSRAASYNTVAQRLRAFGFDVEALDLPSLGTLLPRVADISVVAGALAKKIALGRDVVLVGNSYGATVIGEAVRGYGEFRGKDGEGSEAVGSNGKESEDAERKGRGRVLGLIMVRSLHAIYLPNLLTFIVPLQSIPSPLTDY